MRRVVPAMTQRFINGSAAICSRKASGVFLTQQFYQRKQPLLGVVLFSVQTLTRSVDDGCSAFVRSGFSATFPARAKVAALNNRQPYVGPQS